MALTSSITRALFIAAVALAAVANVEATASKPRPAHHKISANLFKTVHDETKAVALSKRASAKVNAAYYPNWCAVSESPVPSVCALTTFFRKGYLRTIQPQCVQC